MVNQNGPVGLVAAGPLSGSLSYGQVYGPFYGLKDLANVGIDAVYDAASVHSGVYGQAQDFFRAGGQELYLQLVPELESLSAQFAVGGSVEQMVRAVDGLEACGVLTGNYVTPNQTEGLASDVYTSLPVAQDLADGLEEKGLSLHYFVGAYGFSGVPGDLRDLQSSGAGNYPDVSVVLGADRDGKLAGIGAVLGRWQQGRRAKDLAYRLEGGLGLSACRLVEDKAVHAWPEAVLDNLAAKGYVFFRRFAGRNGVFLANSLTSAASGFAFERLHKRRLYQTVVRKVHGYLPELLDGLEYDSGTGQLSSTQVAYVRQRLAAKLEQELVWTGELKGIELAIDEQHDYGQDARLPLSLTLHYREQIAEVMYSIQPMPRRISTF